MGKEKIAFQSDRAEIIGDLYFPDSYSKGKKLPAIIVSAPI